MKGRSPRFRLTWEYMDTTVGKWRSHSGATFEGTERGWGNVQAKIATESRRADRRNFKVEVLIELAKEITDSEMGMEFIGAEWAPAIPAAPPLLDYEYLVTVTARDRSVASAVVDLLEGDRGIEADYSVDVDYRGHRKAE